MPRRIRSALEFRLLRNDLKVLDDIVMAADFGSALGRVKERQP